MCIRDRAYGWKQIPQTVPAPVPDWMQKLLMSFLHLQFEPGAEFYDILLVLCAFQNKYQQQTNRTVSCVTYLNGLQHIMKLRVHKIILTKELL